jgi:hypothetical protein
MTDLLDTGAAWLAAQQKSHAARDVTYSRAAQSVVVKATKGQSRFEVTDTNGSQTTITGTDFIVRRADLHFGGTEVEPVTGDRITDSGLLYEVMSIPGEPVSRETDQYRYQHRIHTKLIGAA